MSSSLADALSAVADWSAGNNINALLGLRGTLLISRLSLLIVFFGLFDRYRRLVVTELDRSPAPSRRLPPRAEFHYRSCLVIVWVIAFCAIAAWAILNIWSEETHIGASDNLSGGAMGLAAATFVDLCKSVAWSLCFSRDGPPAGTISIDSDGIRLRSIGGILIPWMEVREVKPADGPRSDYLCVYVRDHESLLAKLPWFWRWQFRHRARWSKGFPFAFISLVGLVPSAMEMIRIIEHYKAASANS